MECSDRSGARGRPIYIYFPLIPTEHATSRLATARGNPPLSTSGGGPSGQARNKEREQEGVLSNDGAKPKFPIALKKSAALRAAGTRCMTTAEEYRFRLAGEAKTEDERKRFFDMALTLEPSCGA
jgi:hypothetical protein